MKMLSSITSKLPDCVYVVLKNFHLKLLKKNVRYAAHGGKIEISNNNLRWTTHRGRVHLYSQGLLERGSSVGKSYLLDQIDFSDGDTVVDCGANMGDLQLWFEDKNMKVSYLGIEPNPLDFECLSKNMLSGSHCLNLALWNEIGSLEFWVDSKSASSSLIQPPSFSKTITVKASRLDELEMPKRIKLLKLEGEGAEPEMLLGARRFFPRIEFISVDVGPERGIDQTPTRSEVLDIMKENHFIVVLENPYHRKTILFKNSKLDLVENFNINDK